MRRLYEPEARGLHRLILEACDDLNRVEGDGFKG